MRRIERDLDRILTALRRRIRERGFTQVEVQDRLGWGRSYISQLLTKQKALRIEQVVMILDAIGVRPEELWDEIYYLRAPGTPSPPLLVRPPPEVRMRRDLKQMRVLVESTVALLKKHSFITDDELASAIMEVEAENGT